jgi:Concanavalin A-like lectin/glucanases superfamily/Immunoglobulin I-set domain
MFKSNSFLGRTMALGCTIAMLVHTVSAANLINLPFDEGAGPTTMDTAQGIIGYFGTSPFDPASDTVSLSSDSPSGQPGDGSFANLGRGFLMGDDTNKVLNITNGPITMESWIKINSGYAGINEGIMSYGGSYKFGFKGGAMVFTLLGKVDITNSFVGILPYDSWMHVAAAWQPGVGVNFYITSPTLTTNTFVANTNTTARPLQNTFLSIGNEGFVNSLVASYDRVRIHNAALTVNEIDNDAANPKSTYASTKVAYNFNETVFPAMNSIAPSLPLTLGNPVVTAMFGPVWTNDAPSGQPGDFSLAFNLNDPTNRQRLNLDYAYPGQVDLGFNNTNYTLETWVKLPATLPTGRMVLFRTSGFAPRVSLSINPTRTLQTTIYGVQDMAASSAVVPNDNQWHHVAVVMEDYARAKYYIDGVLKQTVNRTDPRTATAASAQNLLIGQESDTVYFKGMLDRVRISNTALSNGELDASPIIGGPFFASQPTNVTITAGATAVFDTTAFGPDPLSYQWKYSPTGSTNNESNVPGGTGATLTINNAQASNSGYYSLVVSNPSGSARSVFAQLVVTTIPIISVNLTNVTTVVGSNVTFSVTAAPAAGYGPLSYQWYYATPGNVENKSIIQGATGSSYSLNNLQLTNQGFYSVVISNNGGTIESSQARLAITAPGTLQPLWAVTPADGRPYITGYNTDSNLRDLERGMGYNPVTDHLLIGARYTSPVTKGIFIVDAATGADVGMLNGSSDTNFISGGTIVMTRVCVADDGAIYACNFGTLSDAVPLKIYRWANETAAPTIAYQGNPTTGSANQQWGKNMTVHGSGTNTQIIIDTRNQLLAVFTTTNGTQFTSTLVVPSAAADDWSIGLAWGSGNTFWGKNSNKPLYQWQLNLAQSNAPLVRTYTGFPSSTFGNFSFSEDGRYMAGLTTISTGPDAVELYDISDLARGPMLVDVGLFPVDNIQTVNQGNVYIARNRVFALNPNNGLVAFSFSLPGGNAPTVGVRRSGNSLIIFWPSSVTGYMLEATDSLSTPNWTTITSQVQGNENQAVVSPSGGSKFYRLKK